MLEHSIARQLAGGWRDNVRLLEQTQPPAPGVRAPATKAEPARNTTQELTWQATP